MAGDMPDDDKLDKRLQNKLAQARRKGEARRRQPSAKLVESSKSTQPVTPVRVRRFPNWHDEEHAGPAVCLRSALFGALQPGRRDTLYGETLATINGYVVMWNGEMLDQDDLDIWLYLLYLERSQPIDREVCFSPSPVLRVLGRDTGKSARDWLFQGLYRLSGGVATLESGRFRVVSSLLGWSIDKQVDRHSVSLHAELVPLFQNDAYTWLDFQRRLSIPSPLGRWLHEFYSTHAVPYPYQVETLRDLCGSETSHASHFRAELHEALDELVTAGFLMSWAIDASDLVQVRKRPSSSQARHVIKHPDQHFEAIFAADPSGPAKQ